MVIFNIFTFILSPLNNVHAITSRETKPRVHICRSMAISAPAYMAGIQCIFPGISCLQAKRYNSRTYANIHTYENTFTHAIVAAFRFLILLASDCLNH